MAKTKKGMEKRSEIVDHVIKLMNEVDFESLTIRMVCDAANISVGTFYHYFSQKSDLVIDILGRIDTFILEEVIPKITNEDEIQNIIMYCQSFGYYVQNTGPAVAGLISTMSLPKEKNEKLEEQERPLYNVLRQAIIRGQIKGQIQSKWNVYEVVEMIIVALRGYAFDWARREGSYDLEQCIVDYITCFLGALKI